MKKSVCVLYIEFFHPQDMKEIEESLRTLSNKKRFPPFRKIIPMIHYKNLRGIRDVKTEVNPPFILPDGK